MRTDALLAFIPPQAPLSLVAGAGVSVASTIIDVLGLGVGVAPTNVIIGQSVYNNQFAADLGIGDDRLLLDCVIGVALATSNSATLNLAFQGAPDTGLTGGYLPGTWQTLVETGTLTAAQCPAGARIARFDWPPSFPETSPPPRFVRLLAQIPASTNFTAGTIAFALPTSARDDWGLKYAARNYKVA